MSNQGDPQLRPFLRGFLRAEADEAAAGSDVAESAADQRLAAKMVAQFAAPPPRRRWKFAAYGLSATAAVALAVVLQGLLAPPSIALRYEMTVQPVSDLMGTAAPDHRGQPLRKDDVLQIQLRPRSAISQKIACKAFIHDAEGYREWPVVFQNFPEGTLRLRRRIAELPPLPTGTIELVVVLCPDKLPPDEALLPMLSAKAAQLGAGCQRLAQPLAFAGF